MGLLDILNGMANGPRGERQPGGGGGMSPVTMALMGVLAYKAVKGFAGASSTAGRTAQPTSPGAESGTGLGDMVSRLLGRSPGGAPTGGTGAMTPGGLAALFSGGSAGTLVSGGLENLMRDLHDRGLGQVAQSWVGDGPNHAISPNDLANALGTETVDGLAQQTGMSRADLLSSLSQHLPELINQLTPNGRLPTAEEASRAT